MTELGRKNMKKRVLSIIAMLAVTVSMAGCTSSCEASGGDDANASDSVESVVTTANVAF